MNNFQKQFARVSVCTLNQWAMDFSQNKKNIIESIQISKQNNCTLRVGPELEIPGYGCEDHFLEMDTELHSWQVLGDILQSDLTNNILCDIGMPVLHKGCLYNSRILCLNSQIILIRPKISLAENGNYREPRWFTSWKAKENILEMHQLPEFIQQITKQKQVQMGNAIIQTNDTSLGYEICEELWAPNPMNLDLCLDGCEIIINPSASHYEMRKQKRRINLMTNCMNKTGGIYLYSNSRGCDGSRVYYDGNSIVVQNGKIMEMSDMFSLQEVEATICDVDLNAVRQFRMQSKQFGIHATNGKVFPRVEIDYNLCQIDVLQAKQKFLDEKEYIQLEETNISLGPSCYLWDYLKRSGGMGYFLALSGGADSASTALIVYNMCIILYETITVHKDFYKDERVLEHLRRIMRDNDYYPNSAKEICKRILFTGYMATENSSEETKNRAQLLSDEINCTHYNLSIDQVYKSFQQTVTDIFQKQPQFQSQGGTITEDLALQNIQARSRMILAYLMGGLIPWHIQKNGFLLVLGSANLDEGLRGYFTKYDCSSADINPIGSISKMDINKFLHWNYKNRGIKAAKLILEATPTAELRPLDKKSNIVQKDEEDMGMTYQELQEFGKLRKVEQMGPYSMFMSLMVKWDHLKPAEVAYKVKNFFQKYAINRHKMTTITPAYHVENYSIDDNRFDLRQFLYNPAWKYQFEKIDEVINKVDKNKK